MSNISLIETFNDCPTKASLMLSHVDALMMASDDGDKFGDEDFDAGLALKTRPKTKRPSRYRVLLLNDDYTPMEFVIFVLEEVFNKTIDEATQIMLHVHNNGVGECGVYPYEIAETKVTLVMDLARRNQHPLQCVMEKQ